MGVMMKKQVIVYTDTDPARVIPNTVHVEKGEQSAVVVHLRDQNDDHLCFSILGEDDGNWFNRTGGASSFWFPELLTLMVRTKKWLRSNAELEENGIGWRKK